MHADEAESLFERVKTDHRSAGLDQRDTAVLDYAAKLTREPWNMSEADVDGLRRAGLDDRGVHDVCAIASYFAFVNRIADGLGVELEDHRRTKAGDRE